MTAGVRRSWNCRALTRVLLNALLATSPAILLQAPMASAQRAGTVPPQPPGGAAGVESRLRQQRDELDRLRRERSGLEERMQKLQRSAETITEEVAILEDQRLATARLVRALDRQLETIKSDLAEANVGLQRAELEIAKKQDILRRRMVQIYKRGSLYDVEAMLSAESFASLVARYRYLHELTLNDRALVRRVEALRNEIATQRQLLVRLQDELLRNRTEKAREVARLRTEETQGQRNLTAVQRSEAQARARLAQIARDEARLGGVIAALEVARRRAEAAPNARPAPKSTIGTADLGRLDWPVEGAIIYRFGVVVSPNHTKTSWNGMGIRAAEGASVRSVSAGVVVLADVVGTYGPTVILQHGGGDYSVYGSLERIDVQKGQTVAKGQVIGTVGATDPELPPHLHFEVRPKGRAVDPLTWLRAQKR